MSDDQSKIPTTPLITPDGGGLPQDPPLSNTLLDGLLGAARQAPREKWDPPTPEELQRDFPQHEIREILGRGGMGAVYKGWHRNLERMVAIKILPPSLDDDGSGFGERFKREAKAMAQLNHPGIVTVYDAGQTSGGLLYFIMECVEGTDLQKLIKERGRLEPCEALRITLAVSDALAYAHAHGIVHRDIKPSNIMLDPNGNVKVADFGLAKSIAAGTTALTMSNVVMGTLDYISPEVLHGAANADQRADLYAVGVMLYQMLTGKIPRGRFEPPSRMVAGLDRRLDRIVDRALQSDPAMRYTCAAEFSAAIDPVTRSIVRQPVTRAAAASRKKTSLVALAAVGVVAVIAALVHFAPWKKDRSAKGTRSVVSQTPGQGGTKASGDGALSAAATKEKPFINTLGMKFVPVPGTRALFSIWDTRVKDYAAYAETRAADDAWTKQEKDGVPVSREPEHPVVGVSWNDATAFCVWLTEKEKAAGSLPKGMRYRLPTDEEWSRAAGMPEEDGATPKERSGKSNGNYPWGAGFPPSKGKAGNYADAAWHEKFPGEKNWIEGYSDGYATTSPVGSFPPNAYGLFDMGGNVWQWCDDLFEAGSTERVLRGASWNNYDVTGLLSSSRYHGLPGYRSRNYGFRCVLEPEPSAVPASPLAATKEKPFVNTLGMKFVPVPGTRVLFSIWETRVKDYAAFAAAKTVDPAWMFQDKDGTAVSREPDQPVCGVNWDDAKMFCEWLSAKEIADGKLPAGMKYRLPTDEEWSRAVGLEKEDGMTPKDRSGKDDVHYPWGTDFPPKKIVGNYAGAAFHEQFPGEQNKWIEGYTDGFATTAPVGSFAANEHGIFDLGGNVWEWCEDLFEPGGIQRVVRGGSWAHFDPNGMLSSFRRAFSPEQRLSNYGFRCVLDSAR